MIEGKDMMVELSPSSEIEAACAILMAEVGTVIRSDTSLFVDANDRELLEAEGFDLEGRYESIDRCHGALD